MRYGAKILADATRVELVYDLLTWGVESFRREIARDEPSAPRVRMQSPGRSPTGSTARGSDWAGTSAQRCAAP